MKPAHTNLLILTSMIAGLLINSSGCSDCSDSCSNTHRQSRPIDASPGDASPREAIRSEDEQEIINAVNKVCRLLATDPLTVDDVLTLVGTLEADYGLDTPLIVHPFLSAFQEAHVLRNADRTVSYVRLILAADRPLTFATAKTAFGEYEPMGLRAFGAGTSVKFRRYEEPGLPYTCSIIAQVTTGQDLKRYVVTSLKLRREKR